MFVDLYFSVVAVILLSQNSLPLWKKTSTKLLHELKFNSKRRTQHTHGWSAFKGFSTKPNQTKWLKQPNGIVLNALQREKKTTHKRVQTLVRPLWFTWSIQMINDVVSLLSFVYASSSSSVSVEFCFFTHFSS